MTTETFVDLLAARCRYIVIASFLLAAGCAATPGAPIATPSPSAGPEADPRPDLAGGYLDAAEAIWNLELISQVPRSPEFSNPNDPADFDFANTDLAFRGS